MTKTEQLAANKVKTAAAEAQAAKSNAAKLAARPKVQPQPKALKTGSGALVGVADGAMDNAPHTKRAVQQKRAELMAQAKGGQPGEVLGITFKGPVWAKPADHKAAKRVKALYGETECYADPECVTDGHAFANKTRMADFKLAKQAAKQVRPAQKAEPRAPSQRKTGQGSGGGKAADTAKITVAAEYAKGPTPYKAGTKAEATFLLFRKAKTVAEFRALVAANPSSYDAGYLRYSSRDGFITVG